MTLEAFFRAMQGKRGDLDAKVIVTDAFYGDRDVASIGRRKDGTIVIRLGKLIRR